jgi:PAS domain S-box-containing protein
MGALADLAARAFGRNRHIEEAAAILAESGRAMMIVDGDEGKIVQANAAAYALFGPPLVGANLDRVVPERYREAHRVHSTDYMQLPVARPMSAGIEVRATLKDGRETRALVSLTPISTTRLVIAEIDPLEES